MDVIGTSIKRGGDAQPTLREYGIISSKRFLLREFKAWLPDSVYLSIISPDIGRSMETCPPSTGALTETNSVYVMLGSPLNNGQAWMLNEGYLGVVEDKQDRAETRCQPF